MARVSAPWRETVGSGDRTSSRTSSDGDRDIQRCPVIDAEFLAQVEVEVRDLFLLAIEQRFGPFVRVGIELRRVGERGARIPDQKSSSAKSVR